MQCQRRWMNWRGKTQTHNTSPIDNQRLLESNNINWVVWKKINNHFCVPIAPQPWTLASYVPSVGSNSDRTRFHDHKTQISPYSLHLTVSMRFMAEIVNVPHWHPFKWCFVYFQRNCTDVDNVRWGKYDNFFTKTINIAPPQSTIIEHSILTLNALHQTKKMLFDEE